MADDNHISFLDALNTRYGAADTDTYDFKVADASAANTRRPRKEKSWEMVGFESTRQKQSAHSKLHVVCLHNTGISTAERKEGEIKAANLVRVRELDISENVKLNDIAQVDAILRQVPSVTELVLSDIPFSDHPQRMVAPSPWATIRTLSLNRTGVQWSDLRALKLPMLVTLKLEGNGITSIESYEPAADGEEPVPAFPQLEEVNLAHNKLAAWTVEIGKGFATACPKLHDLNLAGNGIGVPQPDLLESPEFMAFAQRMRTINLLGDEKIVGLPALNTFGAVFRSVVSLRLGGATVLPALPENLARMMTIASLPKLEVLNNATVRPKERMNAELFYLQRALAVEVVAAEGAEGGPGEEAASARSRQYPCWSALQEKYKDVVLTTSESGARPHVLLNLDFHCLGHQSVSKRIPSMLTVGKLKAIISSFYNDVDFTSPNTRMVFRPSGQMAGDATVLDDDLKDLTHFGVCEGCNIQIDQKE